MKEASFAELFEEAKKHDAYWVADAIYGFTKELHNLTETAKVSRSELARRLAVSPAYITKIFRGDVNFTIDTMVRLARALGGKVHLHVAPDKQEMRWVDVNSPKKKVAGQEAQLSTPPTKVAKVKRISRTKKVLDQLEEVTSET